MDLNARVITITDGSEPGRGINVYSYPMWSDGNNADGSGGDRPRRPAVCDFETRLRWAVESGIPAANQNLRWMLEYFPSAAPLTGGYQPGLRHPTGMRPPSETRPPGDTRPAGETWQPADTRQTGEGHPTSELGPPSQQHQALETSSEPRLSGENGTVHETRQPGEPDQPNDHQPGDSIQSNETNHTGESRQQHEARAPDNNIQADGIHPTGESGQQDQSRESSTFRPQGEGNLIDERRATIYRYLDPGRASFERRPPFDRRFQQERRQSFQRRPPSARVRVDTRHIPERRQPIDSRQQFRRRPPGDRQQGSNRYPIEIRHIEFHPPLEMHQPYDMSSFEVRHTTDPDGDLLSISPQPPSENEDVVTESSGSSPEYDYEADRWSVSSEPTDEDFT